ncbi:MAG TPA: GNAT family N-acetyltransferase [Flavisolibacter sp.]|nr:GNAT family N-acetyltransferase [Flavisolibacter sp.]
MQLRILQTGTKAYDEMVTLRVKVLLDPVGIPRSYINPEKEAADVLIGAFENDQLLGCCVLTHVDDTTLQLRQMAVDNTLHKKGIGAAIVAFAEAIAKEKGYQTLMMHARDTVLDFYRKSGYHITGEPFVEVGIGHHRMEKRLS